VYAPAEWLCSALALGVALAFAVAVTLGVALADAVVVALGFALGFALAFTATPLLQTNLPLFFTHVYFIPPAVLTCPAFLHAAPAVTAADEPGATTTDKSNAKPTHATIFLIGEDY
jgi:hypothetical protein